MARILVAEDERDIRDLVGLTLEFNGHEVVGAKDGQEAVEIAQRDPNFDLILMDVRMPRMTGYEACRQIKSMPGVMHIPIIFLSAKGQEGEVQQGLKAGAERYILKPFAPDTLIAQIQQILATIKVVK